MISGRTEGEGTEKGQTWPTDYGEDYGTRRQVGTTKANTTAQWVRMRLCKDQQLSFASLIRKQIVVEMSAQRCGSSDLSSNMSKVFFGSTSAHTTNSREELGYEAGRWNYQLWQTALAQYWQCLLANLTTITYPRYLICQYIIVSLKQTLIIAHLEQSGYARLCQNNQCARTEEFTQQKSVEV